MRTSIGVLLGLAAATAGWQIGPAATWLPPVRARLTPGLDSPMPTGQVAVTFDDGPHPAGTPAVLDVLDNLGWRATFFVLGREAERHPELLGQIRARGHHIGIHGYDHRYLIARTPAAANTDLAAAVDTVATITGVAPRWWRPPYGVLSGPSLLAASRHHLRPLLWSAWGHDWEADATGASIAGHLAKGRLDGGTILLHDSDVTSAPDSWRRTVDALPLLAEQVSALNLTVALLPDPAG